MSEPKTIKIGSYNVQLASNWYGLSIWALFLEKEIVLFDYIGMDAAHGRYFFKRRKGPEIIMSQPLQALNTSFFKPFLLDMEKVRYD